MDPGRIRGGYAIGLRDGALLALIAGGMTCAEVARLRCSALVADPKSGRIVVTIEREGWVCKRMLDPYLSARVLAWLAERRGYGEDITLLVDSRDRPLSRVGVSAIVSRYRSSRRPA